MLLYGRNFWPIKLQLDEIGRKLNQKIVIARKRFQADN